MIHQSVLSSNVISRNSGEEEEKSRSKVKPVLLYRSFHLSIFCLSDNSHDASISHKPEISVSVRLLAVCSRRS